MVRPVRIAVVGLVLFLAAAGAGVGVVSRWGPERTRTGLEEALAERLGSPVSVATARLYFKAGALSWMKGVLLDAGGIETLVPEDASSSLSIAQLQAELDPLALLRGDVRIRALALDGVRAHVDGSREPEPPAAVLPEVAAGPPEDGRDPLPAPDGPPHAPDGGAHSSEKPVMAAGEKPVVAAGPEPLVGFLEAVADQIDEALTGPLRGQRISIDRSELAIVAPPLGPGGPALEFVLRDVQGRLEAGRGGRARLALTGRIVAGNEEAPVELGLARSARGELAADLVIRELPLASAEPVLTTFLPTARIAGQGELSIEASRPQPGVFRLSAQLDAKEILGVLPRLGDGQPVPLALGAVRSGIEADVDPERVRIARAFVAAEGTELTAQAEIARPIAGQSNTTASISLDHYDLDKRKHLIALLPPRQIEQVDAALEPLRSGQLEDVHVAGRATLDEWWRAFDDEVEGLLPETVTASAHFRGFAVRAGESETLTDLSGRATFQGDRIELRGMRGRRAGHWMPVLDATLEGVSNLAGNARLPEIPDDPDAPLMLGLRPMYDIVVDPNRPPGEMPGALLLDLDHVIHPTLVWPLRNLFARAIPDEDGIHVLVEHGVWGRVPIRAEGVWTMQPDGERKVERISVRVDVKPPLVGLARLDPRNPIWARGRWHLDPHNLGAWRVESSTGAFHAKGQNVRLLSYDLDLGIAGRGLGEGTIDFSKPEELPYWTTMRVVDAKAPGIVDKIGFEPHEATGDVVLDGDFRGELRPGRKVLAGMEGRLRVSARDGSILKRLPVLLAVAKATDTFNPFGSREQMRYATIDATLRLDRGKVHAEELRIDGPDVRLLATGAVDALDPQHPVEAVVGVFFFKALDRMIGVVPVISDLLLGEDENLMGAYVELSGPWKEPHGSLVPLKTLATGPASVAMEGVPRFVRRAIAAIQSAFEGSEPDVAAPPPAPRGEDS